MSHFRAGRAKQSYTLPPIVPHVNCPPRGSFSLTHNVPDAVQAIVTVSPVLWHQLPNSLVSRVFLVETWFDRRYSNSCSSDNLLDAPPRLLFFTRISHVSRMVQIAHSRTRFVGTLWAFACAFSCSELILDPLVEIHCLNEYKGDDDGVKQSLVLFVC